MVPDLRGHGGSTKFQNGGQLTVLQAAGKDQLQNMFQYDVEACRIFLQSKKNVNIDKLCVVGAEMGAVVALNYAALGLALAPVGRQKARPTRQGPGADLARHELQEPFRKAGHGDSRRSAAASRS